LGYLQLQTEHMKQSSAVQSEQLDKALADILVHVIFKSYFFVCCFVTCHDQCRVVSDVDDVAAQWQGGRQMVLCQGAIGCQLGVTTLEVEQPVLLTTLLVPTVGAQLAHIDNDLLFVVSVSSVISIRCCLRLFCDCAVVFCLQASTPAGGCTDTRQVSHWRQVSLLGLLHVVL
jgi:hypothetical protein